MHASPLCSAQRTSRAVAASATWLARGAPRDQLEAAIRAWVGSTTWALMSRRPFLAGRPHGDSLLGLWFHLAPMDTSSPKPSLQSPPPSPILSSPKSPRAWPRACTAVAVAAAAATAHPGTQLIARHHRRCGPWGDEQRGRGRGRGGVGSEGDTGRPAGCFAPHATQHGGHMSNGSIRFWSNTLLWWMQCSAQISKWLHDRLVC